MQLNFNKGALLETFVKQTAGQMTYYGLFELLKSVNEKQLCVLFRNNHFSVLFKLKNELYALITDTGFKNDSICWERLSEVNFTFFHISGEQ